MGNNESTHLDSAVRRKGGRRTEDGGAELKVGPISDDRLPGGHHAAVVERFAAMAQQRESASTS
jgi:hypothetical protein